MISQVAPLKHFCKFQDYPQLTLQTKPKMTKFQKDSVYFLSLSTLPKHYLEPTQSKLEPNAKGVVHAARHLRVESNSSRKLLTSSVKFNPIVTNNKSGRANRLGQLHGSLHSGDKIRICDLNKVSHRQIQMTATSLQSQVRTRQIFQRVMDQILEGTEGATAIMDDTLIAGRDVEHHDAILHKVIERATSYKLKLNL